MIFEVAIGDRVRTVSVVRKDAVLHALPGPAPATGRPPSYGHANVL